MEETNYSAPILLDALFRDLGTGQEFVQEIGIMWKSILSIKSYPYPDDWDENRGDKFFVTLHQEGSFLCKGPCKDMFKLWKGYLIAHGKDFDF